MLTLLPPSNIAAQTIGSIPFPMLLNDELLTDEIDIQIDDELGYQVEREALLQILERYADKGLLESIRRLPNILTITRLDEMPLLDVSIDDRTLSLIVTIHTAGLKTREIPMTYSRAPDAISDELIPSSDFSMYMNIFGSASISYSQVDASGEISIPLILRMQPNIDFRGIGLNSQISLNSISDTPITLDQIRLFTETMDQRLQFLAGDISYDRHVYQSDILNTGLVFKNTEERTIAAPDFSSYTKSIVTDEPIILRVQLNGRQLRTISLKKGNYLLSNFPFVSGINELVIETERTDGSISHETDHIGYDTNLIPMGDQEFQYGLGAESWDLSTTSLFGYHSFGILDQLTVGYAFQGSLDMQYAGASIEYATSLGTLLIDAGASRGSGILPGYIGHIEYRYLRPGAGSLTLDVQYMSEDYTPYGSEQQTNETAFRIRSSIGASLFGIMGLTLQGSLDIPRDSSQAMSGDVGLNISTRLSKRISLATESRIEFLESGPSWTGTLSISLRPDTRTSLFSNTNLSTGETNTSIFSSPEAWKGNGSLSASITGLTISDPIPDTLALSGSFQSPYFDTRISQNLSRDPDSLTITTSQTNISLGTAMAYADGYVGISRPIADSFLLAVIEQGEKSEDVAVAVISNGGNPYTPDPLFGTILIPNIVSGRENQILIDALQLPPEMDIENTRYTFRPGTRQGAVITVHPYTFSYASGVALYSDGIPVSYITGSVFKNGLETPDSYMFTDNEGRFYLNDLTPGSYEVKIDRYPDQTFKFRIDADTPGFVDLQTIELTIASDHFTRRAVITDSITTPTVIYTETSSIDEQVTVPYVASETKELQGRLLFTNDTPVAFGNGGIIKIRDTDFSTNFFTTDQFGSFSIPDLRPGRYRIVFFSLERFEFELTIPDDPSISLISKTFIIENLFANGQQGASVDESAPVPAERSFSQSQSSDDSEDAASSLRIIIDPDIPHDSLLVEGVIMDARDRPVPFVQGGIYQKDRSQLLTTYFSTDQQGRFSFKKAQVGEYTIRLFYTSEIEFRSSDIESSGYPDQAAHTELSIEHDRGSI